MNIGDICTREVAPLPAEQREVRVPVYSYV
jgi:hypothetical protein